MNTMGLITLQKRKRLECTKPGPGLFNWNCGGQHSTQVLLATCDFTFVKFVYGNSQHILIISLDFIWFSLCGCHF